MPAAPVPDTTLLVVLFSFVVIHCRLLYKEVTLHAKSVKESEAYAAHLVLKKFVKIPILHHPLRKS